MLSEALASSGPQLVAIQAGTSWGAVYLALALCGFLVALVVLNYKNPQMFSKVVGAMTTVYLAVYRAAINVVVSVKTFKAKRKEEQAKVIPVPPVDYTPPPNEAGEKEEGDRSRP